MQLSTERPEVILSGPDEPAGSRRFEPWLPVVLFAGMLLFYLTTLGPGVMGGDAGEYQFVPYILSMPHPTGTPLYILISKVWSMLPLGPSVAWRLNLLSAVSASLAVAILYRAAHLLVGRVVPALVAALMFAFGFTFWEQATMADKYAFNALLFALVLYLALRWSRTRSRRDLYLLALAYGFSLAHHRTMVLVALPLVAYVWWYERGALWRDRRRLVSLGLVCGAPLLLYLYLPWSLARGLPPGQWQPQTLLDWIVAMYDEGWIREIRVVPLQQGEMLVLYGQFFLVGLGAAGLVFGLAGLVRQLRQRLPDALFLLLVFVPQALLAANYQVPRRWVFFLPSFLVVALWMAEGLGWVWNRGERQWQRWPARWGRPAALALAVPLLVLPVAHMLTSYDFYRHAHQGAGVLNPWRQELKWGAMGERMGQAIAGVAPDAVIVCDWEQSTPLWYYQQVEGWRPDVQILYPVERLDEAAASGRPLYFARAQAGLSERWHPSNAGPLIALQTEPSFDLPQGLTPVDILLGDTLELAAAEIGEGPFYASNVVPLTLYWRARAAPDHDYSISLRLFAGDGRELFRVDSQHPVLGTYPTTLWVSGEIVGDYYEIQLPPDLAPGTYTWGVLVYRALPEGGWENLKVAGTGQEVARGGSIQVQAR